MTMNVKITVEHNPPRTCLKVIREGKELASIGAGESYTGALWADASTSLVEQAVPEKVDEAKKPADRAADQTPEGTQGLY